jgi:hypothetical protein
MCIMLQSNVGGTLLGLLLKVQSTNQMIGRGFNIYMSNNAED